MKRSRWRVSHSEITSKANPILPRSRFNSPRYNQRSCKSNTQAVRDLFSRELVFVRHFEWLSWKRGRVRVKDERASFAFGLNKPRCCWKQRQEISKGMQTHFSLCSWLSIWIESNLDRPRDADSRWLRQNLASHDVWALALPLTMYIDNRDVRNYVIECSMKSSWIGVWFFLVTYFTMKPFSLFDPFCHLVTVSCFHLIPNLKSLIFGSQSRRSLYHQTFFLYDVWKDLLNVVRVLPLQSWDRVCRPTEDKGYMKKKGRK